MGEVAKTDITNTPRNGKRCTFKAAGYYWYFYATFGNQLAYESTTDITTWTGTVNTLGYCSWGGMFDIHFDGSYVWYVRGDGSSIYINRGLPQATGVINFDGETLVENKGSSWTGLSFPCVMIDASGYPVVGWLRQELPPTDDYHRIMVGRSTSTTGWVMEPGWPKYLYRRSYYIETKIQPITTNRGLLLLGVTALGAFGWMEWDGTSWSDWAEPGAAGSSFRMSSISHGDTVRLVYKRTQNDSLWYNYFTPSSKWVSGGAPVSGSIAEDARPQLCKLPGINKMILMWEDFYGGGTSDAAIYYEIFEDGVWQGEVLWKTVLRDDSRFLYSSDFNAFEDSYVNEVCLSYAIWYDTLEVELHLESVFLTLWGFIWVEDTKFCYTNEDSTPVKTTGSADGAVGTDYSGYIWIDDRDFFYVDELGEKRSIRGTRVQVGSETPGDIWVEGALFHYTEERGDERTIP